jgi:hypothetical protein
MAGGSSSRLDTLTQTDQPPVLAQPLANTLDDPLVLHRMTRARGGRASSEAFQRARTTPSLSRSGPALTIRATSAICAGQGRPRSLRPVINQALPGRWSGESSPIASVGSVPPIFAAAQNRGGSERWSSPTGQPPQILRRIVLSEI